MCCCRYRKYVCFVLSVFVVVLIFSDVKSFRVRALLFVSSFHFTFYLFIYLQLGDSCCCCFVVNGYDSTIYLYKLD